MTYYNTTNVEGQQLDAFTSIAKSQEEKILGFFRDRRMGAFTPFDVEKAFPQWPITSIRRSITDLTEKGLLTKLDQKTRGKYGRPNYLWTVA